MWREYKYKYIYNWIAKCPDGPVIVDTRCKEIGNPPKITFNFSTIPNALKVKLNGGEIIDIDSNTRTISSFIDILKKDVGVGGDIVCLTADSKECDENNLEKSISDNPFTLEFFYVLFILLLFIIVL